MTGLISERLALLHGYPKRTAVQIRIAACMHDIGKSKIPESILDKPGKLSDSEYDIVKLHTVHGYILMKTMHGALADISRQVAMYHHERYDGCGYWSMTANQQPEFVKIITLADVFTALLEERAYKPAWPFDKAVEYIRDNAGSQFDPRIAELFLPIARDFDLSGLGMRR